MADLTWQTYDPQVDYHESLVDRPKPLTLLSATSMAQAAIEQATTVGANPLESASQSGAASLEQAPEIDAGMASTSATGSVVAQQAAAIAPLGQTSQSTTGDVAARYFAEDFHISAHEGDTIKLAWGPTDKGQFA